MRAPVDDPTLDPIRRLQEVRDDELDRAADSPGAQRLLASILADERPRHPDRTGITGRLSRRGRGSLAAAAACVLALAGGAGALLIARDGPPTRNELRAGASNGALAAGETYVDVPIDPEAGQAELRRQFGRLGYDIEVDMVPAAPLLDGRIISASGSGGGELIRELRRDCPELTPCGQFGLKVPEDFAGEAVIALGSAARPDEPYVHVRSFQARPPHCLALVGRRAGEASGLIETRLWPQADPLWFDVETGRTHSDANRVSDMWVVDALKVGGYLDDPDRDRPPRLAVAVASRRWPPPAIGERSGRLRTYQQITQQGC